MTEIVTRSAPQYITDFLKTATKGQVDYYLSQGEPQCLSGQFFVDGYFATKIFPCLRGVIVGQQVDTPEKAIEAAEKVRKAAMERDLEPFDEEAFGLGTEALDLQDQFEENLLRIEEIAHIGTMQDGTIAEPLERILETMEGEATGSYAAELAYLDDALKDCEEAENIVQMMRDHGTVGFLLEVSVPKQTPNGEGSASIHYHTRYTEIVYGATFQLACSKALAWAKAKNASFSAKVA